MPTEEITLLSSESDNELPRLSATLTQPKSSQRNHIDLLSLVENDDNDAFNAKLLKLPPPRTTSRTQILEARTKDHHARTPLHLAVVLRRREMVRSLIAAGADVMALDAHGLNALVLLLSPYSWDSSVCRLLLKNKATFPPFSDSSSESNPGELLSDSLNDSNNRDDVKMNLLKSCNNESLLLDLLALLKPDSPNFHVLKSHWSTLHFAARFCAPMVASVLLKLGADPNFNSEKVKWSALHCAIVSKNIETCKILIEAQANVNYIGMGGRTPFLSAAKVGDLDILQLLAENSADTKFTCDLGWNALHWACSSNSDPSVVSYLVDILGIPFSVPDKDGKSAVDIAIEAQNDQAAACLLLRGAKAASFENVCGLDGVSRLINRLVAYAVRPSDIPKHLAPPNFSSIELSNPFSQSETLLAFLDHASGDHYLLQSSSCVIDAKTIVDSVFNAKPDFDACRTLLKALSIPPSALESFNQIENSWNHCRAIDASPLLQCIRSTLKYHKAAIVDESLELERLHSHENKLRVLSCQANDELRVYEELTRANDFLAALKAEDRWIDSSIEIMISKGSLLRRTQRLCEKHRLFCCRIESSSAEALKKLSDFSFQIQDKINPILSRIESIDAYCQRVQSAAADLVDDWSHFVDSDAIDCDSVPCIPDWLLHYINLYLFTVEKTKTAIKAEDVTRSHMQQIVSWHTSQRVSRALDEKAILVSAHKIFQSHLSLITALSSLAKIIFPHSASTVQTVIIQLQGHEVQLKREIPEIYRSIHQRLLENEKKCKANIGEVKILIENALLSKNSAFSERRVEDLSDCELKLADLRQKLVHHESRLVKIEELVQKAFSNVACHVPKNELDDFRLDFIHVGLSVRVGAKRARRSRNSTSNSVNDYQSESESMFRKRLCRDFESTTYTRSSPEKTHSSLFSKVFSWVFNGTDANQNERDSLLDSNEKDQLVEINSNGTAAVIGDLSTTTMTPPFETTWVSRESK